MVEYISKDNLHEALTQYIKKSILDSDSTSDLKLLIPALNLVPWELDCKENVDRDKYGDISTSVV